MGSQHHSFVVVLTLLAAVAVAGTVWLLVQASSQPPWQGRYVESEGFTIDPAEYDFDREMRQLAAALAERGFAEFKFPSVDEIDVMAGPSTSPRVEWLPVRRVAHRGEQPERAGFLKINSDGRRYHSAFGTCLEEEWMAAKEFFPEAVHTAMWRMISAAELVLQEQYTEDWRKALQRDGIQVAIERKVKFKQDYERIDVKATTDVEGWQLELKAIDIADPMREDRCRLVASYRSGI